MKLFGYIIIILLCAVCLTCRKKTNIYVKVFNPALEEYVAGAKVVLMEIKEPNQIQTIAGKSNDGCIIIAEQTTDANGIAHFDKEKLKTNNRYHYKIGIRESWGISHGDPCNSQKNDYLEVGKTQEIQISDYIETQVKIQYNNVFTPGTNGDSLICLVNQAEYYDPMLGHNQGGGGIGGLIIDFNTYYPFENPSVSNPVKLFANRLIIKLYKRKMGVVSDTSYIVKVYPNKQNIIQINW
jgi:hypothetical protein